MKKYKRILDLKSLLKQNSYFLFGPRGTGKSFLISKVFPKQIKFNLLDDEIYSELMRRPKKIEESITEKNQLLIIDEIQKLPKLLDEVHRLIEEKGVRFLLTGSSARKLKRHGANLLAGRAWEANLYPLTWKELPDFNLITYLNYGGLPRVWNSPDPTEELYSYVKNYLKEEIKAEALVRSYERFVYFLETMALTNAQELHYQNISSESGVPVRTLEGYIEVLKDTLVGFELLPFRKTKKRVAYARSKFYFFDVGVSNSIGKKLPLTENSAEIGLAFETFLINEVKAYNQYFRKRAALTYWRTKICEVDLIIDGKIAIEIKFSNKIQDYFFDGIEYFREEIKITQGYLVTRSTSEGIRKGIRYLHYESFLKELWAGKVF